MNVYGYVRISRDEDNKKESIETQRKVVENFALEQGYKVKSVFEDNNISGYTFERPSLKKLKELINKGKVDILVAKDLSRIGRHNAKTLMFLDYLTEHNVRLMLKNDNYDSETDDDSIIGIKTWYNELYLKDLSKKIKTNIKQKQKEGLVIVPNYGYMKDPENPKNILIDEDVVDTIKLIFKMYIDGYGCKKIANYLNDQRVETPAIHKMRKFGFGWKPDWSYKDLWYANSIKRILRNDVYIGTLRCGVTKLTKMKGKKVNTTEEEQEIHENYLPAIISKEDFYLVRELFKKRYNSNVRAKNEKIHRYAGILRCGECGKGFVARKTKTVSMGDRITYVCSTFHRYGSDLCSGHRIFQNELDEIVYSQISLLLKCAKVNLDKIDKRIETNRSQKKDYEKMTESIRQKIETQKEEIKNYCRQMARGMIDESIFDDLTEEAKLGVKKLEKQLENLEELKTNRVTDKEMIIRSVEVLKEIIEKDELTNSDINMLIDKIEIKESDEIGRYNMPMLDVEIIWNAGFGELQELE